MSRDRFSQVGLDRLVRLRWVERTAVLALAGNDTNAAKEALRLELEGSFRSSRTDVRGSLDKTVTILTKIWCRPPKELNGLRLRGLELLSRLPQSDHLPIHWGMVLASYPFWGEVALQVGRLIDLQRSATAHQVQRRVRERYGERETVSRRTRYVLRSFLDWGVLTDEQNRGVYAATKIAKVENEETIVWLAESFVQSRRERQVVLEEFLGHPGLFPFSLNLSQPRTLLSVHEHLIAEDMGGSDVLLRLSGSSRME